MQLSIRKKHVCKSFPSFYRIKKEEACTLHISNFQQMTISIFEAWNRIRKSLCEFVWLHRVSLVTHCIRLLVQDTSVSSLSTMGSLKHHFSMCRVNNVKREYLYPNHIKKIHKTCDYCSLKDCCCRSWLSSACSSGSPVSHFSFTSRRSLRFGLQLFHLFPINSLPACN